jgi:hypothetical protein
MHIFEFGMQDGNGAQLNIQPGACVISNRLDCLYHDVDPNIQILRNTVFFPNDKVSEVKPLSHFICSKSEYICFLIISMA